MSKMIWDEVGKRLYETGVGNAALYVQDASGLYPKGVPWNGLTAFNESPSGAEATPFYADNIQYLNLQSIEKFGGTIEALMYPDEFEECDGSKEIAPGVTIGQQNRKPFGFVYKTLLGNDIAGTDYGYKLHLVYGALAAPSEKAHSTVNESPEPGTMSWEITTTPVSMTGFKPSASLTINSTKVDKDLLADLEDILYGTSGADPRLPLPAEIATLFGGTTVSALALSTIVPADDASNTAITSDVVITFNNKILKESIVISDDDGTMIAGEKTWDETGKILTFNPTASLTVNTTYIVAITGVTDIYNQTLADVVKNFTTVAS